MMTRKETFLTIVLVLITIYGTSYFVSCHPIYIGSQDDQAHFLPSYRLGPIIGGLYGRGPVATAFYPIHLLDQHIFRRDYWGIRDTKHAMTRMVYAF